jgi:hypothetical protein
MLDLGPAADEVIGLVAGVSEEQLTGSTPCAETSVAGLLDHFTGANAGVRVGGAQEHPAGGRAVAGGRRTARPGLADRPAATPRRAGRCLARSGGVGRDWRRPVGRGCRAR